MGRERQAPDQARSGAHQHMADTAVKTNSFAGLNRVLGRTTPPIPYCWSGSEVFLKAGKEFNEKSYLQSKLNTLLGRETVLAQDRIRDLFSRVINQNLGIMFDLYNCSPEKFEQYDRKLNLLLEAAFTYEENELNLVISRKNIIDNQNNSDGWMNFEAVDELTRLNNPAQRKGAPDPYKFVPKYRR